MHLSYEPPSSWRILFLYGGYPRQVSCLEKSRALVVPGGDCSKGVILHGRQLPSGLPLIGYSCPRIRGDVTGVSVHEPRKRNSTYVQTFRRSIYKTRRLEYPHLSIRRYEQRPQGPALRPRYNGSFHIYSNHDLCYR